MEGITRIALSKKWALKLRHSFNALFKNVAYLAEV